MKTKMQTALFVAILAGLSTPGVFAAEGGAKSVSIKLHGGYNMWVLGEIAAEGIGDFAQAGGPNGSKMSEAMESAKEQIKKFLK